MSEIILMAHVVFGVACLLAAVWLFVDVLHANDSNLLRIRRLSLAAATFMWVAFIIAGYWYVVDYHSDKAVILKGPWPFAHSFFMETKEHLVIMLLLMTTYLPIVAANNLASNKDARRLMLWLTAGIALLAFLVEGHGAVIATGVKMGLLPQPH
jgi:hypothetical protein